MALDQEFVKGLSRRDYTFLEWQSRWVGTARPEQLPPDTDWTEYGMLAGRGAGKTRVGAEWLARSVYEQSPALPAAVVAPTQADVRFTCFEGESGLLNVVPPDLVASYNRTDLVLTLVNGGTIRGFSAEKADRLRGPQASLAWCDELAAWGKDAENTWDMLMFGLRLGPRPKVLWTTTPKPLDIIRKLTAPKEGRIIVRGTTFDNRSNLPDSFFVALEQYEGTKIGRQELYGELIDPEESGVVRRSDFRLWPCREELPRFDFIAVSMDTAFTERTLDKAGDPDPTACGVWGVFEHEGRPQVMLLDCWEDHLGFPALVKKAQAEMERAYGKAENITRMAPLIGKPLISFGSGKKPDMLLLEDKGSGISLRQQLAEVAGIDAYAYNPGRADKLARLHIVSHVFSNRLVWLPESETVPGRPKTWCEPLIGQLCSFTGGGSIKHDDHVDQTTQALRVMLDMGLLRVSRHDLAKEEKPDMDKPPQVKYINPYSQ